MFLKIYRYVNILSIDVVLGACVNSWLVSKVLSLDIPLSSIIGLAVCVWLIYTADHLIDAYQIKHRANTKRHFFHQKFFSALSLCFVVILFCGIINVWFLPRSTQLWGCIISLIAILYLIFIAGLKISLGNVKEIFIAAIYTITIFMVPLSSDPGSWHPLILVVFLQLFLLAFLNLLIFSLLDKSSDQTDDHRSLVRMMGAELSHRIICFSLILLFFSFFLALSFLEADPIFQYTEIIYLAMALVLFCIYWKRSKFSKNENYRLWGDLVFLFPLILIFVL
ncbi:hypothetical protein BH23BAC1_BH23BAC1_01870 [soil metagenome]